MYWHKVASYPSNILFSFIWLWICCIQSSCCLILRTRTCAGLNSGQWICLKGVREQQNKTERLCWTADWWRAAGNRHMCTCVTKSPTEPFEDWSQSLSGSWDWDAESNEAQPGAGMWWRNRGYHLLNVSFRNCNHSLIRLLYLSWWSNWTVWAFLGRCSDEKHDVTSELWENAKDGESVHKNQHNNGSKSWLRLCAAWVSWLSWTYFTWLGSFQ